MASSGYYEGYIGASGKYMLRFEWTQEKLTSSRQSYIQVKGFLKKVAGDVYPYNTTSSCVVECAGGSRSESRAYDLRGAEGYNYHEIIAITGSNRFLVTHNTDGTKSVTIKLTFNGLLTDWNPSGYISQTITLDPISVADSFTLPDILELTHSYTVTFSNPTFNYHKLQFIIGGLVDASPITQGTLSVVPSASLASAFDKNKNTASVTVRVYSYQSATSPAVGYKDITRTLKITDAPAIVPSYSHAFGAYSTNSKVLTFFSDFGIYLKECSGVRLAITNAAAHAGASVASAMLRLTNSNDIIKNGSGSTFTLDSGIFNKTGQRTVTSRVTDTRGVYKEYSASIYVADYRLPSYTGAIEREDIEGQTATDRIIVSGLSLSTLVQNSVTAAIETIDLTTWEHKDTPSITVQYKQQNDTVWTEAQIVNNQAIIDNAQKKYPYNVRVTVRDYLGNSIITERQIPSAQIDMHMKNAHVRFGSFIDESKGPSFESDWDAYFGGDHFYIKDVNGNYIDILSKLRNL